MKMLLLLLISSPLLAAKPSFKLMVKSKYDTNWYRITKDGKKWICETKHVPYFETYSNPLSDLDWKKLEEEGQARPKSCQELVGIEDSLTGQERRLLSCLSQKETLSLYERISTLCRSKI